MSEVTAPEPTPPEPTTAPTPSWHRWAFLGCLLFVAGFVLLRLWHLGADFTNEHHKRYTRDGVLYTDEGWYANNAIYYFTFGEWHREGELNFAVNLPVLQAMHFISFLVLGVNIIAVRATIFVSFVGVLVLTFLLIRKLANQWAALLAVGWIATNYFFFLYSRFALCEIPMTMFIMGALYVALFTNGVGKKPVLLSALAGLLAAIALYTKTSAIFAFPLLAAVITWMNWGDRKSIAIRIACMTATALVIAVLHYVLLAQPYKADYSYFASLNVGLHAETDPEDVINFAALMTDKIQIIDKVMYRALAYSLLPLIIFLRDFRRSPLVWGSIAWIIMYLGMFSLYINLRPRYWVPLMVPLSAIIAVAVHSLWVASRRSRIAMAVLVLFGVALCISLSRNLGQIKSFYEDVQYTFRDMVTGVKEIIESDPESRNVMFCHFGTTVRLYWPDVIPVNDRYATEELEYRIEQFRPTYMLVEGDIYKRDARVDGVIAFPRGYEERVDKLKKYYKDFVQIQTWDVFSNYKNYNIRLYRLIPRDDVDWSQWQREKKITIVPWKPRSSSE